MAASFSQRVKNELCAAKLSCKSCEQALLYGMLLFSKSMPEGGVAFNTENKASAELFTRAVINLTGAIVTVTEPDLRNRTLRPIYSVTLEDDRDAAKLLSIFALPELGGRRICPGFFQKNCCEIAFLRGAYLACGTMINPEKEYHLEFDAGGEELCRDLEEILGQYGLEFRQTVRLRRHILYIKESEQLEDTLARLGAVRASMELMNLKMEKELRNQVNRMTNCETANIGKTVSASMEQIRKIKRIQEKIGFDALPPPLKEAASLRVENPDLSLRELCERNGGNLTRSGLNHRLQKLCKIADELE